METGTITPLTKSCLKLWRSVYGCRFGSYDAKPRVQIRDKKRRTAFAHLRGPCGGTLHDTTSENSGAIFQICWRCTAPGGFGCLGFVHTSTQQIPASHQGEDASCQGCNAESWGRSISCHDMPLHLCLHWKSLTNPEVHQLVHTCQRRQVLTVATLLTSWSRTLSPLAG